MAVTRLANILRVLVNANWRKQAILRRRGRAPLSERLKYEALGRNDYAYGMYHGALQARSLGIKRVSALEFGVAGGDGLRAMEQIAWCIGRELGVRYDLYGFDTGEGMPPPADPRDMGFIWDTGLFAPRRDVGGLLKRARLVLGDVRQTAPKFCAEHDPAPLAFVSIDVDYYTSTLGALSVFEADSRHLLPRVFVYLDDIIGDDHELHGAFTGELAAVEDFNRDHAMRKISAIYGLRWKRVFPAPWNDQMFVAHILDHPRYGEYTNPKWERVRPAPADAAGAPGNNGTVTVRPVAAASPPRYSPR